MVYLHVITSDPPYFLNGFLRGERIDQIHCRFGRVAVLLMAADGARDAGRIGARGGGLIVDSKTSGRHLIR